MEAHHSRHRQTAWQDCHVLQLYFMLNDWFQMISYLLWFVIVPFLCLYCHCGTMWFLKSSTLLFQLLKLWTTSATRLTMLLCWCNACGSCGSSCCCCCCCCCCGGAGGVGGYCWFDVECNCLTPRDSSSFLWPQDSTLTLQPNFRIKRHIIDYGGKSACQKKSIWHLINVISRLCNIL